MATIPLGNGARGQLWLQSRSEMAHEANYGYNPARKWRTRPTMATIPLGNGARGQLWLQSRSEMVHEAN